MQMWKLLETMNKIKRKRRKRFNIFIGILKNHHNEYIEIFAKNLLQANITIESQYPGQVDFIYKSSKHSASNLRKIETIKFKSYDEE